MKNTLYIDAEAVHTRMMLHQMALSKTILMLGSYDTLEEAIEARKEGEEKYFRPILSMADNAEHGSGNLRR